MNACNRKLEVGGVRDGKRDSENARTLDYIAINQPTYHNPLSLEIMKILLRDEVLGPDVDLGVLAKQTEAFSGSDLKRTRFLSFAL